MDISVKQRNRLTDRENRPVVAKEGAGKKD